MALEKKEIKMLTSGNESREFLYADDCFRFRFISNYEKLLIFS